MAASRHPKRNEGLRRRLRRGGPSPDGVHGDPWRSMAIHGDPWRSMAIHGDPWRSMAIRGDPWRSVAIRGDPWRSMAIHGDPWRSIACEPPRIHFHATTWNPHEFPCDHMEPPCISMRPHADERDASASPLRPWRKKQPPERCQAAEDLFGPGRWRRIWRLGSRARRKPEYHALDNYAALPHVCKYSSPRKRSDAERTCPKILP